MFRFFRLPTFFLFPALVLNHASIGATTAEDDEDLQMFELETFEVYAGTIRTIDGVTGKEFTQLHPVVRGFRRSFNKLLLGYHKRLLSDEYQHLKVQVESTAPFEQDLAALAASFGLEGFEIKAATLPRERSIFTRLMRDPFFKIEALIVWNVAELKKRGNHLPDTKYARDIRYQEETGQWERRVMTEWKVGFLRNSRGEWFHTVKEQGLNLDTNEGYHFIERGLPANVPPHAFNEVKLTYPIFINTGEDDAAQVRYLKETFVRNLFHIYDPFSWAMRRNTRFRGGFNRQLLAFIAEERLPITDREWFDPVLATFLNDVITIQHWGVGEIYDFRMLGAVRKNQNILGDDLDLLNWKAGEDRSVDYDPSQRSRVPRVHFKSAGGARFILLDAYRRYENRFLDALRTRVLGIEGRASGRKLILEAIEEVSGAPSEVYLRAAAKAQEAELLKYRRD